MNKVSKILPASYDGLATLQQEFNNYQREGFPKRSPEFFCLELNGEAGELANLEKKAWKGKSIPNESFQDEAADVMIALMNYANARGINLAKAVQHKMSIIDTKRLNGTH